MNSKNEILLNALYLEHDKLLKRIISIRDLIQSYNGFLPEFSSSSLNQKNQFPHSKNIKEKIKFILKMNKEKAMSAVEIYEIIQFYEPDISKSSVIQMCSTMAIMQEVQFTQEGKKNLYYIKD